MPNNLYLAGQLFSAVVWAAVGIIPVFRKTIKSPAAWALSLFAGSIAVYAVLSMLSDVASVAGDAILLVKARESTLTVAALLLLFFGKWSISQRKRSDLLLTIPAAGMLLLNWTAITTSVTAAASGLTIERNLAFYVPWIVYLHLYATVGLLYLIKGVGELMRDYRSQYGKVIAVIVSVLVVLVVSHLGSLPAVKDEGLPHLSSLLFVPGLSFLVLVVPVTRESLTSFVKKGAASRNEILHSFLVYHGGSLIASRNREGQAVPDEDIFSAVLEAIQRFVTVSIPAFGGSWLDTIDHGDLKILMVRGAHCFLVLVTTGREDDLLRGEVRDVLNRFEERNAEALEHWNGDLDVLSGPQETVSFFFDLRKVF